MKLRGKRLDRTDPKDSFTKVPNELFTADLHHIEKLILLRLHSYPNGWTLAYTRIGKELGLHKESMIRYWYSLIEKGIILETPDYYRIVYSKIPQLTEVSSKLNYERSETESKAVSQVSQSPVSQKSEQVSQSKLNYEYSENESPVSQKSPSKVNYEYSEISDEEIVWSIDQYLTIRNDYFFTDTGITDQKRKFVKNLCSVYGIQLPLSSRDYSKLDESFKEQLLKRRN